MVTKVIVATIFFCVIHCANCQFSWAKFTIQTQKDVYIEMVCFNGLISNTIFKGKITAGGNVETDAIYQGLALLVFEEGQSYPLIIGDDPFTLNITNPAAPPSFVGSRENELFYKLLSGGNSEGKKYSFAILMIQAKKLLESSHSIHTIDELDAKKKSFISSFVTIMKVSNIAI